MPDVKNVQGRIPTDTATQFNIKILELKMKDPSFTKEKALKQAVELWLKEQG